MFLVLCFIILSLTLSGSFTVEEYTEPDVVLSLRQSKVSLITFYNGSCTDCLDYEPIIVEAAAHLESLKPKVNFGKLNCKVYPDVCFKLNIFKHPSVIIFANGIVELYEGPMNGKSIANSITAKAKSIDFDDDWLSSTGSKMVVFVHFIVMAIFTQVITMG